MDTFSGELVVRSDMHAGARLEIEFADKAGQRHAVSLSADAVAALAKIVGQFLMSSQRSREHLTKFPTYYAVGHGRHEPVVLLRFEDELAYGLSPDQAAHLGDVLLEEAQAMSSVRYSVRQ